MKKVLSILLCLAVMLSLTAFAEEIPQPDATVTLTVNKDAFTVDETGLELTIDIAATEKIITAATVVINIDNDAIEVTDATPVAETTYNYEITFDEITEPGTTAQKTVPLEIAKYDVADGTAVNISIASATIMDNNAETPAEMTSDITSTKAITVNNPVVNAKLVFADEIDAATGITVTYEEIIPESDPEEETPPEGGEPEPQSEESEPPTPKVYATTLTLKADGKTVAVEPVLAEGKEKMADGTYKVVIAADGYKAETVADITISEENANPVWDADMTAGYITDDDTIDLYDFHALCMAIGEEELVAACDLNRDGTVDKKDATLLVKNWTLPVAEEGEEE